jgi:4-hydroxybenzoate polyprenyltransferase
MEGILLIVLFFFVLLTLKLAAIGLVYYAGPLAAIIVIVACYLIARRIETNSPDKY